MVHYLGFFVPRPISQLNGSTSAPKKINFLAKIQPILGSILGLFLMVFLLGVFVTSLASIACESTEN
jgi:hypothetical protein